MIKCVNSVENAIFVCYNNLVIRKMALTKRITDMTTTYTFKDGYTSTDSELAWWVDYAKRRTAAAAHKLAREEITQEQFDIVVDTYAKQAEEFKSVGYAA